MAILRLAKRSETPYLGTLIYFEDENRKILFAGKSYASILAVGEFSPSADHNGKQGYRLHKDLVDANEYRNSLKQPNHAITIDRIGRIYDAIAMSDDSKEVTLIKTPDTVMLSPFTFLDKYPEISEAYEQVMERASAAIQSDSLSDRKKTKAYHLKEMTCKVVTLFKHTYELSTLTCAEFNDDFFDPNPIYAQKTLARLHILQGRIEELLIAQDDEDTTSNEFNNAIKASFRKALEKSEREKKRHGLI